MRQMPGGSRINEETRQFAFVMVGIILVIFFLLILRMQCDRKGDAPEPDYRFLTNRGALQKAMIGRPRPTQSSKRREI